MAPEFTATGRPGAERPEKQVADDHGLRLQSSSSRGSLAAAQAPGQSGELALSTSAHCPEARPPEGSPKAAANLRAALCLLLPLSPPHLGPLQIPAVRGSPGCDGGHGGARRSLREYGRWDCGLQGLSPSPLVLLLSAAPPACPHPRQHPNYSCHRSPPPSPPQQERGRPPRHERGRLIHLGAPPSAWTAPLRVLLETRGPS